MHFVSVSARPCPQDASFKVACENCWNTTSLRSKLLARTLLCRSSLQRDGSLLDVVRSSGLWQFATVANPHLSVGSKRSTQANVMIFGFKPRLGLPAASQQALIADEMWATSILMLLLFKRSKTIAADSTSPSEAAAWMRAAANVASSLQTERASAHTCSTSA